MTQFRFLGLFLIFLLMVPQLQAADVKAYVDRNQVAIDESFLAVFEYGGDKNSSPDFSAIQADFEIVNQQQSSSFSFANGKTDHKVVWTLTLVAKELGAVIIPAIDFGGAMSTPITVTVSKPNIAKGVSGEPLYIEVETDKQEVYVQEQLIYTIRLYRSVELQSADLSEPELVGIDTQMQRLGEDQTFRETIAGKNYVVHERRYAIFPQAQGNSYFEPIVFSARVGRRSGFFIDPFNNQQGGVKRVRSAELALLVKTIPAQVRDKPWVPASSITLEETWSTSFPEFKVGEPVTRNIRISAEGLVAEQLPELLMPELSGLKQYPDQAEMGSSASTNGVVSFREQKLALIPSKPGKLVLPGLNLQWWDTAADQLKTASLPSRVVTVVSEVPALKTPLDESSSQPAAVEANRVATADVAQQPDDHIFRWQLVSLFFASAWVITLVLSWSKRRNQKPSQTTSSDVDLTKRQLEKQLKWAVDENDAKASHLLLLKLAQHYWPNKSVTSLGEIVKHCGDRQQSKEFAKQVIDLEKFLYAKTTSFWQGQDLWSALLAAKLGGGTPNEKGNFSLEPLHLSAN